MRNIFFYLLASVFTLALSSCDDLGATETRAKIIAQDLLREKLLASPDAEFDNGAAEKVSENEYHVVFDVQAKNALGLFVPRKISVRLAYKGKGDWTENENWELLKVSLLDEYTGETDVVYDSNTNFNIADSPTEDISREENPELFEGVVDAKNKILTLGGYDFTILQGVVGGEAFRVYSDITITDLATFKKIYADMKKKGIKLMAFFNSTNVNKTEFYAFINNGKLLDRVNNRFIDLNK